MHGVRILCGHLLLTVSQVAKLIYYNTTKTSAQNMVSRCILPCEVPRPPSVSPVPVPNPPVCPSPSPVPVLSPPSCSPPVAVDVPPRPSPKHRQLVRGRHTIIAGG